TSGRGERLLEMNASCLGVIPLGRPVAEDRLGGGLVPGLGLEFLVGLALELLHGSQLAALLDPHRPLLLGHGPMSLAPRKGGGQQRYGDGSAPREGSIEYTTTGSSQRESERNGFMPSRSATRIERWCSVTIIAVMYGSSRSRNPQSRQACPASVAKPRPQASGRSTQPTSTSSNWGQYFSPLRPTKR